MKIGELANQTGCSVQTIRFYEREGLIIPVHRTQSNYRLYDKSSLRQLIFIKQCRSLDMTIAEIKQPIQSKENPDNSCASINSMIDVHIRDVTKRIEELAQLKSTLCNMSLACSNNRKVKNCGVLQIFLSVCHFMLFSALSPQMLVNIFRIILWSKNNG